MSRMLPPEALALYLQRHADGTTEMSFMVEGVRCAGCIAKLEQVVAAIAGVTVVRLNFSTKKLKVVWQGPASVATRVMQDAGQAGYTLMPYTPDTAHRQASDEERWLLRCLAVAGFASMNVMLLSVSLWSGADQTESQRLLLQWFSALIVLPTVAYAGQPYFRSAWQALRHGRMSMDIPISVAIILTSALSLFDTIRGYGETFFESAAMLLFFLLCGRYLESVVKGRSRNAAEHLLGLQHVVVAVKGPKGVLNLLPSMQVNVGDIVFWRTGERLGVDGVVLSKHTGHVDASVLTGESLPRQVSQHAAVQAGMVNCGDALEVRTTAVGQHTVLAELAKLVETATLTKNAYTRLADQIARAYAPVVHTLALMTFVAWLCVGLDWHSSLLRAAAVLIVTCPCALALAVPTVQVAIIGKLLRRGVIIKSGDALERLAHIKAVVLDKTGTLTLGKFCLVHGGTTAQRQLAARLAVMSRHPLAQGVAAAYPHVKPLAGVREYPGQGLQASWRGQLVKLGSASFCGLRSQEVARDAAIESTVWLKIGSDEPVPLVLADQLRPEAKTAVQHLQHQGLQVQVLSGDVPATVQNVAQELGIAQFEGGVTPQRKQQVLATLAADGQAAVMVGDGLNDAPSLALAPVGVSFGQATDLAKISADIILQQESLMALPLLYQQACVAKKAVKFNFGISLAYNAVAIPLAMAGLITPLWAALLMSGSSIMVVSNAARLSRG